MFNYHRRPLPRRPVTRRGKSSLWAALMSLIGMGRVQPTIPRHGSRPTQGTPVIPAHRIEFSPVVLADNVGELGHRAQSLHSSLEQIDSRLSARPDHSNATLLLTERQQQFAGIDQEIERWHLRAEEMERQAASPSSLSRAHQNMLWQHLNQGTSSPKQRTPNLLWVSTSAPRQQSSTRRAVPVLSPSLQFTRSSHPHSPTPVSTRFRYIATALRTHIERLGQQLYERKSEKADHSKVRIERRHRPRSGYPDPALKPRVREDETV